MNLFKSFLKKPESGATITPEADASVDSIYGNEEAARALFGNAKTKENILDALKSLVKKEEDNNIKLGFMFLTRIIVDNIFKDFNTAIDQNDIKKAYDILSALPQSNHGEVSIKFGICTAVERVLKKMIDTVKREIADKTNQKALQQALGGVAPAGDVLGDMARGVQDLADQKAREKLRESQTKFIAGSTTINALINNLNFLATINIVGGEPNLFFKAEADKIQAIWDKIKDKIPEGVGYSPQAVNACIQAIKYAAKPDSHISNEYDIRNTLITILSNIGNSHKVDIELP